jgi:colicin import membrane protein
MTSATTTIQNPSERRESSVLFALAELAQLEAERVADERARAEAREAETRRARELEAEAREAEQRRQVEREAAMRASAEAEARLRVEAALAHDARLAALRAELERVEAERERWRRSVGERPPEPRCGRSWGLALAVSSLLTASLAAALVMQSSSAVEGGRPGAGASADAAERAPALRVAPPEQPPAPEETARAPAAAPATSEPAAPTPEPARRERPRSRDRGLRAAGDHGASSALRPDEARDDGLGDGDDDVLGGLEEEALGRRPRRPR